jgi:hypothetical protein
MRGAWKCPKRAFFKRHDSASIYRLHGSLANRRFRYLRNVDPAICGGGEGFHEDKKPLKGYF